MMMRGALQWLAGERAAVVMISLLFMSSQIRVHTVLSFQTPQLLSPLQRHPAHQQRHAASSGHKSIGHRLPLARGSGKTTIHFMQQQPGTLCSPPMSQLQSMIQRNQPRQKTRRSSSRLFFSFNRKNSQENNNGGDEMDYEDDTPATTVAVDALVKETSRQLRRISWFSWWAQVILSTISTTILLFAASVLRRPSGGTGGMLGVAPSPPFLLSGLSLVLSATSVVWTWGNGTRLSRRLLRNMNTSSSSSSSSRNDKTPPMVSSSTPPPSRTQARMTAANLLRRAVRIQVTINLLGLFLTILAAEQIVGSLAIKVLTTFVGGAGGVAGGMMLPYGGTAAGAAFVQPLDILVVQANTNTLLSHFVSLATSLFLTNQIRTLDPHPTTATTISSK